MDPLSITSPIAVTNRAAGVTRRVNGERVEGRDIRELLAQVDPALAESAR